MKNVAWFVLVLPVIQHAPTPMKTVVVSTAVLMHHAMVVSVNVMLAFKLSFLAIMETVFSTHVKKSQRLPQQQLLLQPQQLLRRLQQQRLNAFQIVIWIALASVASLSVTHLTAAVEMDDLLLPASTFQMRMTNANFWSTVKMVQALVLLESWMVQRQ